MGTDLKYTELLTRSSGGRRGGIFIPNPLFANSAASALNFFFPAKEYVHKMKRKSPWILHGVQDDRRRTEV